MTPDIEGYRENSEVFIIQSKRQGGRAHIAKTTERFYLIEADAWKELSLMVDKEYYEVRSAVLFIADKPLEELNSER